MHWIAWAVAFFGRMVGRPSADAIPEIVVPVLSAYEELKDGLTKLVASLEGQVASLNRASAECVRDRKKLSKQFGTQIGRFKKEIDDCNQHRTELQKSVNELKAREVPYTHGHMHFIKDYLHALELDLTAKGIEPIARKEMLQKQEEYLRQQQETYQRLNPTE